MSEKENLLDKELNQNEIVKSSFEIKYKPARILHRVLANLIDFLVFLLIAFSSFLVCRNVIVNSDKYKEASTIYKNEEIKSCLYYNDNSESYPTITEYIDDGSGLTHKGKHNKSKEAVEGFYSYAVTNFDSSLIESINEGYTKYLLNNDLKSSNGFSYITNISFLSDSVTIEENLSSEIPELEFYENIYKPFIDDQLLPLFGNSSKLYKENIVKVAMMFLTEALPISVIIGLVLTFFVPPLFFRRGRQTLGKALYKIAIVGPDCLSIKLPRFFVRTLIFVLMILLLSIFTFMIPILISFSMMIFSKKHQSFPDFIVNSREVDASSNKIYFSLEEIVIDGIPGNKKPVDFKPERDL